MTITSTIIEDTPDHTVTLIIDDVLHTREERLVYKAGTKGANQQTLLANAIQALQDIRTAQGLINTSGWDGLTANQRKLIVQGILTDLTGLIRFLIGDFTGTN